MGGWDRERGPWGEWVPLVYWKMKNQWERELQIHHLNMYQSRREKCLVGQLWPALCAALEIHRGEPLALFQPNRWCSSKPRSPFFLGLSHFQAIVICSHFQRYRRIMDSLLLLFSHCWIWERLIFVFYMGLFILHMYWWIGDLGFLLRGFGLWCVDLMISFDWFLFGESVLLLLLSPLFSATLGSQSYCSSFSCWKVTVHISPVVGESGLSFLMVWLVLSSILFGVWEK